MQIESKAKSIKFETEIFFDVFKFSICYIDEFFENAFIAISKSKVSITKSFVFMKYLRNDIFIAIEIFIFSINDANEFFENASNITIKAKIF